MPEELISKKTDYKVAGEKRSWGQPEGWYMNPGLMTALAASSSTNGTGKVQGYKNRKEKRARKLDPWKLGHLL